MDGYKKVELEKEANPRNSWPLGLSLTIFHLRCRSFFMSLKLEFT
jgi:hypothetical protein